MVYIQYMTNSSKLVVTEHNIDALLREYEALSFSFVYRKLSLKDAARKQELEDAFAAIEG